MLPKTIALRPLFGRNSSCRRSLLQARKIRWPKPRQYSEAKKRKSRYSRRLRPAFAAESTPSLSCSCRIEGSPPILDWTPHSMIRFEDLLEKVRAYSPDADVELLRRAYVF